MCIKIIGYEKELEFNTHEPLEHQILGATDIFVNYDPIDPKISCFMDEIERMAEHGISCNAHIKVNNNSYIEGIKLEKRLKKIKTKLHVNEIVKNISLLHTNIDKKLGEISEMCLGKNE